MNRIGGKSTPARAARTRPLQARCQRRFHALSAIKQVASGRFGVTSEYLVNADELQIKMAQGAKPGEGGQLPGHKVDPWIAKVRHSTPGVGLISPPPHHDIYSIEDLAQLIHDLKNANPDGAHLVKLVAEVGVGTVAAGVAKATPTTSHLRPRRRHRRLAADLDQARRHRRGRSAWPRPSRRWCSTAAQPHRRAGRRQLKTGRDVVIGALLGAEEFGFATAPLVAAGCIMMRKCHLNTCPVGVATQDPVLRKRFTGQPEHVVNFFFFVAEECANDGAARLPHFDEMIGRTDLLDSREGIEHWKARGLDFSNPLPARRAARRRRPIYLRAAGPRPGKARSTTKLIEAVQAGARARRAGARSSCRSATSTAPSAPCCRARSPALRRRRACRGHDPDRFTGSPGQSFGAFLPRGVTFELDGDANDYVGKGLSGGDHRGPPAGRIHLRAEENIIVGNTVLYGATAGEAISAAWPASASRAQLSGATRWSRASAITAANT
jgi:glutamate synthase (NADPH) large chain